MTVLPNNNLLKTKMKWHAGHKTQSNVLKGQVSSSAHTYIYIMKNKYDRVGRRAIFADTY